MWASSMTPIAPSPTTSHSRGRVSQGRALVPPVAASWAGSLVSTVARIGSAQVQPAVHQLLAQEPADRVEAGVREPLAELEVDPVDAAAVLLEREYHPVVEALGHIRLVDDMMAGHRPVLVV